MNANAIMKWNEVPARSFPGRLGATPTLFNGAWHSRVAGRTFRWGLGAVSALQNPQNRPVIDAANVLLAWLTNNACTQNSVPEVAAFQAAYNASGQAGQLSQDGQYGGNTQAALQATMQLAQNDAGGGPAEAAPANCFGMAVPATPALDPTNTPGQPDGSIVAGTVDYTPWIVGGVAAAALGAVGWAYWKRHHRRRR